MLSQCKLSLLQPKGLFSSKCLLSTRAYNKVLTKENLSSNVLECEYAVRGKIPIRGEEIMAEIKKGSTSYSFEKTTSLNIGNP